MNITLQNRGLSAMASKVERLSPNGLLAAQSAMRRVAENFRDNWVSLLGGEKIPGVNSNLRRGIENAEGRVQIREGHRWVEVYSSDPQVIRIENGHGAHDMKKTHPRGRQSRLNKKGEPYLIVPFRKGQDSARKAPIPPPIQKVINREKKAGWPGTYALEDYYYTDNARGKMARRKLYKWGRRVDLNPVPFRDATNKYKALYRIVDAPFPLKDGRAKTADYGIISFRVITEKQAAHKWIIPAKAGQHFLRKLVMRPTGEGRRAGGDALREVRASLEADLGS